MKKSRQRQALDSSAEGQIDKVSQRIKAIRANKGISQTEFAEKMGVERSNYHRMENRGEKLTFDFLEKVAKALDVSIIQLVSDSADEMPPTTLEVNRLQKRLEELEDRLRDKQQIIESLDEGIRFIQKSIFDVLFITALDLKLAFWHDLEAKDQAGNRRDLFSVDNWGAERVNEKGENIIIFGSLKVSLTAADLFKIYEHLESQNPNYFDLFNKLEHVSRLPAQSLVRRTLQASLINKLPKEKRDSLFKEGYPPHLKDLFR